MRIEYRSFFLQERERERERERREREREREREKKKEQTNERFFKIINESNGISTILFFYREREREHKLYISQWWWSRLRVLHRSLAREGLMYTAGERQRVGGWVEGGWWGWGGGGGVN